MSIVTCLSLTNSWKQNADSAFGRWICRRFSNPSWLGVACYVTADQRYSGLFLEQRMLLTYHIFMDLTCYWYHLEITWNHLWCAILNYVLSFLMLNKLFKRTEDCSVIFSITTGETASIQGSDVFWFFSLCIYLKRLSCSFMWQLMFVYFLKMCSCMKPRVRRLDAASLDWDKRKYCDQVLSSGNCNYNETMVFNFFFSLSIRYRRAQGHA